MTGRRLRFYLYSFILAFSLTVITVIFRGSPEQNFELKNSYTSWFQNGFFSTNDISNYILSVLFFLSAPFLIRYVRIPRINRVVMGLSVSLAFLILLYVFFRKEIMIYPLNEFLSLKPRIRDTLINSIFIPVFISLFGIFYLFMNVRFNREIFARLLSKVRDIDCSKCLPLVMIIAVFVAIDPSYRYSYGALSSYGGESPSQFHHSIFYLGPVNDILNGKNLLTDSFSQYGILSVYSIAAFMKIFGVSFASFSVWVMIVSASYVLMFSVFLYRFLAKKAGYLLGTLFYLRTAFIRPGMNIEIYTFPSSTPYRYIFDILSFLAVYFLLKNFGRNRLIIVSVIFSAAYWYGAEIGIPLTMSFLVMLAVRGIITKAGIRNTAQIFVLFTTVFLVFALAVTSIFFLLTGNPWIIIKAVEPLFIYSGGFLDFPMPLIGLYWIVLYSYILTYYSLHFEYMKTGRIKDYLPVFILVYGLSSFVYYLGLNVPDHLYTVSHPAVILYIWLFYRIDFSKLPGKAIFTNALFYSMLVFVLFWMAGLPYRTITDIKNMALRRYFTRYSNHYNWDHEGAGFALRDNDGRDFAAAVSAIRKYASGQERALILSRFDTLLYVMSGRSSPLPFWNLEYAPMKTRQIEGMVSYINKIRPKYVFFSSFLYDEQKSGNIPMIWEAIKGDYRYVENAGVIDVYIQKVD